MWSCVLCHLGKLVFFGVYFDFQRRVREGVKGDLCFCFLRFFQGSLWEVAGNYGKNRRLRRMKWCHSDDRKRKVPKYPFLLSTCFFLASEQVKIVFLGRLGLTADSKPEKWHWSHLVRWYILMDEDTPWIITFLGTVMVDFEVFSLQPKSLLVHSEFHQMEWWFLFPQLLLDSKVNFRNDFRGNYRSHETWKWNLHLSLIFYWKDWSFYPIEKLYDFHTKKLCL